MPQGRALREDSPEVRKKIAAQRRTASISSVIIALMFMVLVGLILYLINFGLSVTFVSMEVAYVGAPGEEQEKNLKQGKVRVQTARKPTPPGGGSPSRVVTAMTSSPTSVPVSVEPAIDQTFGLSENFGTGDDEGFGGGSFGNLPGGAGKRCSDDDRLARLLATGGTAACETAVVEGLRFLKKQQNKDGSWGEQHRAGLTGLALLAYLGHCETPVSMEFGETVHAATAYLIDRAMKNEGRIFDDARGHWCYEHAIATYALCESDLFSRSFGYHIANLDETLREAVKWIIKSQNSVGSWGYRYGKGGRYDTSITAWHLQALKAAKAGGRKFSKIDEVITKGLDSLLAAQGTEGGFGYNPDRKNDADLPLTGAGVLCLQQHRGRKNFDARQGIAHIAKNSRFAFDQNANLYEHYYVSQAAINEGGSFWKSYNKMVRDDLLEHQNADGSWPNPPGNRHSAGPIYDTALAILMLEVYYRYLPGTSR